jgi:hypothetical protein
MISFDAVFIVHEGGFVCANEGETILESDVILGLDGLKSSVKRSTVLKIKNAFVHGQPPVKDQPVTCLTRMTIGNIFHYEGFVSYVSDDGITGIKLTSKAQNDRIKELMETIAKL